MRHWGTILALSVMLVACGAAAATVTPAATATPAPTATPTITPTATPIPTPTPTPTPAPTATVTPLPVCSTKDGQKVYDLMKQFAQEWDDALKLADSTPRLSLAPQIAKLQEIRRKVQAQEWPSCAQPAYTLLVQAMDQYINGFISFLGQKPEYLTQIQQANTTYQSFMAELQRITR